MKTPQCCVLTEVRPELKGDNTLLAKGIKQVHQWEKGISFPFRASEEWVSTILGGAQCLKAGSSQTKVIRVREVLTCQTFNSSYSSRAAWNWAGVKPRDMQRCSASENRTLRPPETNSRIVANITSAGLWVLKETWVCRIRIQTRTLDSNRNGGQCYNSEANFVCHIDK